MKKYILLATIFSTASLVAIASDDYPMLNQEAQEQQTQDQQTQDQRLQDQRLQDQRLQNQRLDSRRQDQRLQDRRLQDQRQRNLVADNGTSATITEEAKPQITPKDRFTTTEDHKLANKVRSKIDEITGGPSSVNNIILVIDNGDVKLVGKVPSAELRTKIGQAITQMKGVKSVHNRLEVSKSSEQ
jgi:osmotically-inducible protein OsmY